MPGPNGVSTVRTGAFDDQAANPDMIIEAVLANGYPAEVLQAGES